MNTISSKGKSGRPPTRPITKPYLMQAVEHIGGVGKLAEAMGIDQEHISKWLYSDRKIPAHRVNLIVKATNNSIKAWQLRPDVFEESP